MTVFIFMRSTTDSCCIIIAFETFFFFFLSIMLITWVKWLYDLNGSID